MATTVPMDIVTMTTGRRLRRHTRRSGAPRAANRAQHKTSAPPQNTQLDTLGRGVSDTHGTFVPASLSLSYRGVGRVQASEKIHMCMYVHVTGGFGSEWAHFLKNGLIRGRLVG